MNRLWDIINSILFIIRSKLLYNWRFNKCGDRVVFGHLNRIIGYKYIEIGRDSSFGNNLRLEAVSKYGGVFLTLLL